MYYSTIKYTNDNNNNNINNNSNIVQIDVNFVLYL